MARGSRLRERRPIQSSSIAPDHYEGRWRAPSCRVRQLRACALRADGTRCLLGWMTEVNCYLDLDCRKTKSVIAVYIRGRVTDLISDIIDGYYSLRRSSRQQQALQGLLFSLQRWEAFRPYRSLRAGGLFDEVCDGLWLGGVEGVAALGLGDGCAGALGRLGKSKGTVVG